MSTPERFRETEPPDPTDTWADTFEAWRAQASDDELAEYYEHRNWRRP